MLHPVHYFDYCLSLIIYFNKTAIQKLTKAYYTCLLRLFKFNFVNNTLQQTQAFLSKYHLNSFHHKILIKLTFFAFNIKHNSHGPINLQNNLKKRVTSQFHNFRTTTKSLIISERCYNKHGEHTFQNFFARFFNCINFNRSLFLISDFFSYKSHFFKNINTILSQFVKTFVKFDFVTEVNTFLVLTLKSFLSEK